jgi:hypothetical protein
MSSKTERKAPVQAVETKTVSAKAARKARIRDEQLKAEQRNRELRANGQLTPWEQRRQERKLARANDPQVLERKALHEKDKEQAIAEAQHKLQVAEMRKRQKHAANKKKYDDKAKQASEAMRSMAKASREAALDKVFQQAAEEATTSKAAHQVAVGRAVLADQSEREAASIRIRRRQEEQERKDEALGSEKGLIHSFGSNKIEYTL